MNAFYANMAADWLSKCGHLITGAILTTVCFNTEFQKIVMDDTIGRTLLRRAV